MNFTTENQPSYWKIAKKLFISLFHLCSTCCHKAERVHELNEEIGKLLARAEQLGGEGNVDEAQQLLEMVEKTRALKKEAEVRAMMTAVL